MMTNRNTAATRGRLRPWIQTAVLMTLAIVFVQMWLVDGLLTPCYVEGRSMAECLLGDHSDVVCGDCGLSFLCDATARPRAVRAVCPNCGWAANDMESLPDICADRVLIDRTAFVRRWPRRWETVAFRRPQQTDQLLVKRIVGLPGETIEILHGDVYADGQMVRKGLAEQRAMAVLVHDAFFLPVHEPLPPLRWQPAAPDSQWLLKDGFFSHPASMNNAVDWLVYRHWRRAADGSVGQAPITDTSSYDPTLLRREEDVSAVADLLLSFQVESESVGGALFVRTGEGDQAFEVELQLDPSLAHYRVRQDGKMLKGGSGDWEMSGRRQRVDVSLIDQQLLLAVNDETLVAWPFERPEAFRPATSPVAIGVADAAVTISGLRLYRDVYYTSPAGSSATPVQLAEASYYVLGDNSPASEDSRTWPDRGAIDRKWFLGKPFVAISMVPVSPLGGVYFQVPNLGGIRYIR